MPFDAMLSGCFVLVHSLGRLWYEQSFTQDVFNPKVSLEVDDYVSTASSSNSCLPSFPAIYDLTRNGASFFIHTC
jgi:hypothetical protein